MNLEGYSDQFIEYYNYHKKYTEIYGNNTVVLLQNGSFFLLDLQFLLYLLLSFRLALLFM